MRHKFKIKYNSPVVLTFVLACLGATILGIVSAGALTQLLFATYRAPFTSLLTYLRLFTHVLGHVGWEHFFSNATLLLLLGPMLEEKYGRATLIYAIAATALVTGLVNTLFFPNIALCGASGVVFAFILLASFTEFKEGDIPLTFILISAIYIGEQIISSIFIQDNISNMAHIVGGIVGALFGYFINKKK